MKTEITISPVTVIGAGSYGTSLAIAFSRNGSPIFRFPRHYILKRI